MSDEPCDPVEPPHGFLAFGSTPRYSSSVLTGDLIITSGQIGAAAGGAPVPFERQAELALQSLIRAVEGAGGGCETILRVNSFLARLEDFDAYDAVYARIINSTPRPARRTVVIAQFKPPILVEVDAIALARTAS